MPKVPQFTQGVFSQKFWRGVGDIDDCVVLADLQCVHAVTPWASLPSSPAYRTAAGNPDDPVNADGMSLAQSMKALGSLFPGLAVEKIEGGAWAPFIAKVKGGRCASVGVYDATMATKNGAPVRHRVSVYWNGTILRVVNPIRGPHTIGTEISETELKRVMVAYPDPGDVYGIVFPTVDDAFKTHPLYVAPTVCPPAGFTQAQMDAAVAAKDAEWQAWVATHPSK